jgi:cysteine-rich CPCC protein
MLTTKLPDGRELQVSREALTGNWVAQIRGTEGASVAGRWLLAVLAELLELSDGEKPQWVDELVQKFAGEHTAAGLRYACPCCDLLTLTDPPTGTFAICPVCRWEDDNVQYEDLDTLSGANAVSLRQARANFQRYGVSDPRRRERARPPRPEERPAAVEK